MCIFAIISAVNKNVTIRSQINVTYCKGGTFSKVFGVFRHTDVNDTRAQNLINLLTHNCKCHENIRLKINRIFCAFFKILLLKN